MEFGQVTSIGMRQDVSRGFFRRFVRNTTRKEGGVLCASDLFLSLRGNDDKCASYIENVYV